MPESLSSGCGRSADAEEGRMTVDCRTKRNVIRTEHEKKASDKALFTHVLFLHFSDALSGLIPFHADRYEPEQKDPGMQHNNIRGTPEVLLSRINLLQKQRGYIW